MHMKREGALPLWVICWLLTPTLMAQPADLGNWLIYFGNKQLDGRWNIHHEAQFRNYNAIGDVEQILLRTGLGYNLTENNHNVLLGYGFIHSQNYVGTTDRKKNNNENRIFQQFITFQRLGRVSLQHRYRFEQRWFDHQSFRMRYRYFLSLNIALNNPKMLDGTFYCSAYNEIFINDRGDLFDRNRLYGGLGYRLNPNTRFEVGYMNQFLTNESRDQINLITFFTF